MKDGFKNFKKAVTSRLFILFVVIIGMFCTLSYRLFYLQIVKGEEYQKNLKASILRELTIPAPRGTIYDRFGRPLAINKPAFSIKLDSSIKIDENYINQMILDLTTILETNDEKLIDELPISNEKPLVFLFDDDKKRELNWKKSLNIDAQLIEGQRLEDVTAEQTITMLATKFKISPETTSANARKIISLRYSLYQQRYKKYQPITLAVDVKQKTVVQIEEEHEKFPGVYTDVDSLRVYPEGGLFANMLGYIRLISDTELATLEDHGYTQNDLVGKSGLEKGLELDLKGTDGEKLVEVDAVGRRISTVETKQPKPGNKVFLTIDQQLQKVAYDALVTELKNVIISKLTSSEITVPEVFSSLVGSNTVSIEKILDCQDNQYQAKLKRIILNKYPNFTLKTKEDKNNAKILIETDITNGIISSYDMLLTLYEQKIITFSENDLQRVKSHTISTLTVVVNKILSNELTPQQLDLDPSTGSVVVEDVNTGEVLAMVSYPTFDNNLLVNNLDYDYYSKLLNDPTAPLLNRPLVDRKAPGSTFKMVTAIAGLEEKIISPYETIRDMGIFTKAGSPAARCWIYANGGTHGMVNVAKALEVSCNYFFYETSYRMGNSVAGTRLNGIETLNKYMKAFGLDAPTGVEIEEEYSPVMASPENLKKIVLSRNKDATPSQYRWTDGETIRAAIGQSCNNYTPASMAKYVATLANGGTRYKMHLVNEVLSYDGNVVRTEKPTVEETLHIKKENLDVVYKGMLAVTSGTQGTMRGVFKNFPVKVAAKTGTAQQNLTQSSHTWFVCFAPLENPQISISILIPFGESKTAPAGKVAKKIIESYLGLSTEATTPVTENSLLP